MSQNQSFSVSVVIPAYNAEATIERAIESVLHQTRPPEEIIVVDDGSTDRTAEKVQQYGGRVRYLFQEHRGANEARNCAIEQAQGNWIALLDADDEWLPKKLEVQHSLLERNPHLVWAYGNYHVRKPDGSCQEAHDRETARKLLGQGDYFPDFLEAYAQDIPVHTITMLIRRDALMQVGMFLPGQILNHDPDVALRLAYQYPGVGYSPEPLAIHYFGRAEGITQRHWRMAEEKTAFLLRHLDLSARFGKRKAFEICAAALLQKWIRDLLAEEPNAQVLKMTKHFRRFLPVRLRAEAWLRCRFPRMMPPVIDWYFKMKNRLRKGHSNGI
ncbi:MAG: glycosyltransferase family 2 protein [Anaerohalosphaeraceae bacterium]